MPRTKQRSHLDSTINSIVARAASEIAAAVRADVAAQVSAIVGGKAGRGAGRAAAAPKAKGGKFHRRSPAKIASDNEKLLAFIKSHPGLRSEDIQKQIGMPKPDVTSGLVALRDGS